MMKCDKDKVNDDKDNNEEEEKKDENEGEPGRRKGKWYGVKWALTKSERGGGRGRGEQVEEIGLEK